MRSTLPHVHFFLDPTHLQRQQPRSTWLDSFSDCRTERHSTLPVNYSSLSPSSATPAVESLETARVSRSTHAELHPRRTAPAWPIRLLSDSRMQYSARHGTLSLPTGAVELGQAPRRTRDRASSSDRRRVSSHTLPRGWGLRQQLSAAVFYRPSHVVIATGRSDSDRWRTRPWELPRGYRSH